MRRFLLIGALLPLLPTPPVAQGDQEAQFPFAHIEYKHERTFLKVDVIQLDITVAEEVGREVERLVAAHHAAEAGRGSRAESQTDSRSGPTTWDRAAKRQALEDSIADAYLRTPSADVSMLFLRSVSHRQFTGGRDDALELMVGEDLLTEEEAEALTEDTDRMFAFLRSAPLRSGDTIRYAVRGDTVRTWVIWEDGTVALDVVRTTRRHRLYTMGSLFAPGAEFRDGLLRTILDPNFPMRRPGLGDQVSVEATCLRFT